MIVVHAAQLVAGPWGPGALGHTRYSLLVL